MLLEELHASEAGDAITTRITRTPRSTHPWLQPPVIPAFQLREIPDCREIFELVSEDTDS
jgi:hypothetical protein